MEKIRIQNLVLGMVGTNVYLVQNPQTQEMLLIDPADEAFSIEQKISAMAGKPKAILLTHAHFDHIMAADELRKKYHIQVYLEKEEEALYEDPVKNLSANWGTGYSSKADILVSDREVLHLAGFEIHVLHTPGHTKGSCCYYFPKEKVLFSGDTLFHLSYGRTDTPTGSGRDMQESLQRLFREIPEDVSVYPGHMEFTSMDIEKRYNPLA